MLLIVGHTLSGYSKHLKTNYSISGLSYLTKRAKKTDIDPKILASLLVVVEVSTMWYPLSLFEMTHTQSNP